MIPGSFSYHRPATLAEAVALLQTHGDEALILAGGHSLIPMMKLRMAQPEHLIDLQQVAELKGISIAGGFATLGAMTTQADLIADEALAREVPILRETSLQIADPQIRSLGTVGGNVANGDPGNDMPALMQCLDAAFVLHGTGGERTVAAREFYEGAYFTARAEDEILTAIRVPVPAAGHGWAYEKQKRKIGDYATAAAAVVLTLDGGVVSTAAIALTNVGETPLLATDAAQALIGTRLEKAAIDAAATKAMAITEPAEDGRGTADFRTHVAGVMVRRAIAKAAARAGGAASAAA